MTVRHGQSYRLTPTVRHSDTKPTFLQRQCDTVVSYHQRGTTVEGDPRGQNCPADGLQVSSHRLFTVVVMVVVEVVVMVVVEVMVMVVKWWRW